MKQNATATAKGFIYQFYEAIDWCWKLEEGESLYIETFGDISIADNVNIEVKNVKTPLTNMGECFWKTLGNWLDVQFQEDNFKTLILLTTQEIGTNCLFSGWNDSTCEKKQEILMQIINDDMESYKKKLDAFNEKIKNEKDPIVRNSLAKTKPKLNSYVDTVRKNIQSSKLLNIVSKFIIMDSSRMFDTRYKSLCDLYGKGVLSKNVKMFINSQIGFILSPVSTNNQWKISYDDFTNEINHLTETLSTGSRIFPTIKNNSINTANYQSFLFVTKIKDIKYDDVIDKACSDYVNSMSIIFDSFSSGEPKARYDSYLEESIEQFDILYRIKSRRCTENVDIDSQDFYDHFSLSPVPTFSGYEQTKISFRNGVMHIQMDEPKKNKKWKLK